MSLILEALRKSEADRRRGETPNVHVELSPSPATRRHPVPAWAWWMIAAVMGAAGWWLHERTSHSTPHVVAVAATTPVAVQGKSETGSLPPVRHLTPPPVQAAEPIATANPIAAVAPPHHDLPMVASTPTAVAIAPLTPAGRENRNVMRLSDLSTEERRGLPPLKLSMHMWNDDPTQRFVILDGNRLHEGDRIGEAIVTTITTDGVILDLNGRHFEIPIR